MREVHLLAEPRRDARAHFSVEVDDSHLPLLGRYNIALLERPTFRDAFRSRRCLILADEFYEWDAQRQPVYFYLESGTPFAFAGLWNSWKRPEGETVNSCTVILSAEDYDLWLDRGQADVRELRSMLSPYPAAFMKSHPVGRCVGDTRREGPECVAPLNMGLPGVK